MNNIHAEFRSASGLQKMFIENEKYQKRYEAILVDMEAFIKVNDLNGKVKINKISLGYAIVDYFEDIRRLKEFHEIKHINSIKIIAYTSYWLLLRKPIQLVDEDKDLLYINERFVLAYISDFISREDKESIIIRQEKGLHAFIETLFYFLKYRISSPYMLELSIVSFFAGQIYQENTRDLSASFEKYDKKYTQLEE